MLLTLLEIKWSEFNHDQQLSLILIKASYHSYNDTDKLEYPAKIIFSSKPTVVPNTFEFVNVYPYI